MDDENKYWERYYKEQFEVECSNHAEELDALRKEREELQKQLYDIANPSIEFLRNEFTLTQKPDGILGLWLKGWTQLFIDQGAENYIEFTLRNALNAEPHEEYIFNVQKKSGKTPHQLRQEVEAERDILRKQLESANNEVANLHKMLEIAETAIIAVTTDEEIEANKDLWTIEQVEETLRFARNEINRMREKTRREVQDGQGGNWYSG